MFDKIKARLKGIRTFLAAGAVGLVGSANLFGAIDIAPLLRYVVKDENQVGAILVVLAIGFALLRMITNTSPGASAPDQVAPVKSGVDVGM